KPADAVDGRPFRRPSSEIGAVAVGFADDNVEVLEEEQRLAELVEDLEAVAQRRQVPVPLDEVVAEAVDGAGPQAGEIAVVAGGRRRAPEPVPQFQRRLLGEGAEHDLARFGQAGGENVQGPADERQGLARPWPGDQQDRPPGGRDGPALLVVEVGQDEVQRRRHGLDLTFGAEGVGLLTPLDPAGPHPRAFKCLRSAARLPIGWTEDQWTPSRTPP